MINYLNGLNTGILINDEGFLALALKIKTSNGQTNLFYLQGEVLRDLMMVLQNRAVSLHMKAESSQQDITARVESATQELVNNIPVIEARDLEQPDPGCILTSLSVSFDEDDFKLLLIQKNEALHHIKVSDAQIQFVMVAIARALDNFKSVNLLTQLTSGINYAPVYDAEFNPNGTMDYSILQNEHWKLDLFNQFTLIIYGIENKDGLELKFGAVIKTHAATNEQELDVIARNLASRSKRLMPYTHQLALIKFTAMPFDKDGMPSPKEALQPLAEFHKALRTE
jgi:hypothetical protein